MNLFLLFHFSKRGNRQKKPIKREGGWQRADRKCHPPRPPKPFCSYKEHGLRSPGQVKSNRSLLQGCFSHQGGNTNREAEDPPAMTSVLGLCLPTGLWWARWCKAPVLKESVLSGYLARTGKCWVWAWALVPSSQQVQNQCKHILHL